MLKYGLEKWELVEFHEDGLGGYNAGNLYFKEYVDYYIDVFPSASDSFINTLSNTSFWTAENGKYCQYKDYFDYIHSMSIIHSCEARYFYYNMIYKCSSKELRLNLENKKLINTAFERNCWGKI